MFNKKLHLLLAFVMLVALSVTSSSVQAQKLKKLKFSNKSMMYDVIGFGGLFELKDQYKGDYLGGRVGVGFSTSGESKKVKQFYLGTHVTHVQYNYSLQDSSLSGGSGKGRITGTGIRGQWLSFKDTRINEGILELSMKHWTERLSYTSNEIISERTQTNWVFDLLGTYKIVKTTGLINRIQLGARLEIPSGSPKFDARQTDSRGNETEDLLSRPVKRREYNAWLSFGPSFPIGGDWIVSTQVHTGYTYKEQDRLNYYRLGGILTFSENVADIFQLNVIPEFSKSDVIFHGDLSVNFYYLVMQLF